MASLAVGFLGNDFHPDGLDWFGSLARERRNLAIPCCGFVELGAPLSRLVSRDCETPSSTPHILAVLGNHDHTRGASPFLQRNVLPDLISNWEAPGGVALREFGELSVITLDSELWLQGPATDSLTESLRRARGRWRILAAHHPLSPAVDASYSRSAPHDAYRASVREAIERAGVTVHAFLAGHDHCLAVTRRDVSEPINLIAGSGSEVRERAEAEQGVLFRSLSRGFIKLHVAAGSGRIRASILRTARSGTGRLVTTELAAWNILEDGTGIREGDAAGEVPRAAL